MHFNFSINNKEYHVLLKGDYEIQDNDFIIEIIDKFESSDYISIIFDFSEKKFLESGTLGVLLLARNQLLHVRNSKKNIFLKNIYGRSEETIRNSNFHSLFNII